MEQIGSGLTNLLFNGLSCEEAEKLIKSLPAPSSFKRGDELYKNGYISFLNSGKATVKRKGNGGQVLTVRTLLNGEIFGAASLFGEWKQGASSVIAETDGEIVYISEEDFKKILVGFPNVAFNYINFLTEKIRFLNRRIDAFSACSTEQRLYEFLTVQKDKNGKVTVNGGMSLLAKTLNVGRTSLYRDMNSLENKGLIKRNGNIITIF